VIVTKRADGWAAVRRVVFQRDRGCVAVQKLVFGDDVAPDICRDGWGNPMAWDDPFRLDFAHVKEEIRAGKRADDDEAHGVAACPWHHRLGRVWRLDTKARYDTLRDYLRVRYPQEWKP
jgi:hypothetical protein